MPKIKPEGMLFEASGDVFVAGEFEGKWTFMKFMAATNFPVTPAFYRVYD